MTATHSDTRQALWEDGSVQQRRRIPFSFWARRGQGPKRVTHEPRTSTGAETPRYSSSSSRQKILKESVQAASPPPGDNAQAFRRHQCSGGQDCITGCGGGGEMAKTRTRQQVFGGDTFFSTEDTHLDSENCVLATFGETKSGKLLCRGGMSVPGRRHPEPRQEAGTGRPHGEASSGAGAPRQPPSKPSALKGVSAEGRGEPAPPAPLPAYNSQ